MGDVNCDGESDSIDMLFILRYDVNIIPGNVSKTCDLYCNAIDALLTLQCEVGIKSKFCPAIAD